jgi:hypothetical protein
MAILGCFRSKKPKNRRFNSLCEQRFDWQRQPVTGENLGAVYLELTPEDLRNIESAAAQIKVEGARYQEALEQLTGS